ncbi:MAG: hypothetical protein Q9160_007445 [Pyrenula sp. 1 TL-2023]
MAQNNASKYETARRISNPPLSLRTTSPNEEFFTDSLLEGSKIPSPSPIKTSAGATARPRRAIGNTRTLKDAWEHSAKIRNRSTSTDFALSNPSMLKLSPAQAQRRSTTPGRHRYSESTPSPPRPNTAGSLTGPFTDFSSPPKGLEDVYQRIADEENLAAQEGELSEEDGRPEENQRHRRDRSRLDQVRTSASSMSLRGSRRASPRTRSTVNDVEEKGENKENVLDDGTAASQPSDMSFLENLTDQVLAAKLTPHALDRAKDRARLERALQRDSPMFERIRSNRDPLGRTNLHPGNSQEEANSTNGSSGGSVSSGRLDAPLNVPRNWGNKAKPQKGWLKRIYSPNGSVTNEDSSTSQVDWTAAAADVPLPTAEDGSSARGASSTPTSIAPKRSLDRIRQWELNDFTAQSLQVSQSPPVRQRNTVLHDIRDREISSVEKRAVTTNRLGEIRRRESHEHLSVPRPISVGADQPVIEDIKRAEDIAPATLDLKGMGEPIPDTPIVIYRGQGMVNGSANGNTFNEKGKENRRPTHKREDSHDSLRRLARAFSQSPRPSSSEEDWSLVAKDEKADAPNGKSTAQPTTSSKALEQVDPADSTPQKPEQPTAARTPIVVGAWQDTLLSNTVKTEKQQAAEPQHLKTPHVTGGWIDTPLANARRHAPTRTRTPVEEADEDAVQKADDPLQELAKIPSEEQSCPVPQAQPDNSQGPSTALLPRSALESLLDRAKVNRQVPLEDRNDTLNLGDATIDSLEDLLTLDNADMTALIRMGAQLDASDLQNEASPVFGTETELLERLGTKLDRLRTNIHDARKGISKLEHQVSNANGQAESGAPRSPSKGPCQTCGCPSSSLTSPRNPALFPANTAQKVYLAFPIPRIMQDRKPNHWAPRLTLLGCLVCFLAVWFLSEKVTCAYYCHPLYAEFYSWPLEPEPMPGVALPTMLWRWVVRPWLRPILSILWPVIKAVGMMLGVWDGFADGPSVKGSFVGRASSAVGTGPDLSMMNDEYL